MATSSSPISALSNQFEYQNLDIFQVHSHCITLDEIQPQWLLDDTLLDAVYPLFGIREDNIGFLVIA
jgi:hypothetical protein